MIDQIGEKHAGISVNVNSTLVLNQKIYIFDLDLSVSTTFFLLVASHFSGGRRNVCLPLRLSPIPSPHITYSCDSYI